MQPDSVTYACLQDVPVLVTGGASGIGASLVAGFAAQGARTAFIDIEGTAGAALVSALHDAPHRPLFIQADLSRVEDAQQAVHQAARQLGGLKVLVNNAARDDRHDPATISETDWDASQAINLKPLMFVTQAAVPYLEKAPGAAVVNFSSIAYLLNMGDLPAYGAAKAGIIGLTKTLAGRFGPAGIRVNAVLPGMVVTERQKTLWLTDEGVASFVAGRQCLKRPLTAIDLVGPCLFLASSQSAAMTAQSIIVDGGVF
ncbi:SDR family NAD(P)-dependent oxidoreductase [Rhizobium sp. C1]|uniref:SDR family NAD(P)-dependent oxidoreductase n=1 Tax=Rhizobium sp. C1 TaxID=1349799 RepID=UPI001E4BDB76|nr:SDR family oxidoreductase [Rhizobium sp. C1]MCD2179745.1 SDR family oxidoreductase [Rhizobium sp. C1]